jgi:glycosyltransferase involved in cell wall biosynthesis
MTWLFATSRFPWPMTHGTHLRVYHLSRALAEAGESVSLLAYPGEPSAMAAYTDAGVNLVAGLSGEPPSSGAGQGRLAPCVHDATLADRIEREAGDRDVVVLVRERSLQYAPQAKAAKQAVIADIIDDPLRVQKAVSKQSGLRAWARRVGQRRYERRFAGDVDRCVFVSEVDSEAFVGRNRRANVACIANGVDTEFFTPASEQSDEPVVVFVGNMAYPPNDEAAQRLIDQIAPIVWQSQPQARFTVVGPDPSESLQAMANERVTITGYVDDVRPYLREATVVSLPMVSGAGIKNKLLEAWAMGRCVVASSLACQGVDVTDGSNLLIADSDQSHADAICRAITDGSLRNRLAAAGRDVVETQYTWAHAAQRLCQCAQEVSR